jgi:hypothetical protein
MGYLQQRYLTNVPPLPLQVAKVGLLLPRQYVVCVQQVHDDFCLKIMTVNEHGSGICQRQQRDEAVVRASPRSAYSFAQRSIWRYCADARCSTSRSTCCNRAVSPARRRMEAGGAWTRCRTATATTPQQGTGCC